MTESDILKLAKEHGLEGSGELIRFASKMFQAGREDHKAQVYHLLYSNKQKIGEALGPVIVDEISDWTEAQAVATQHRLGTKVLVARDHIEAEKFVGWLNSEGYRAKIGSDTHHRIDGRDTHTDDEAHEMMQSLWNRYCDEA